MTPDPAEALPSLSFLWHPEARPDDKDSYIAFRAEFELTAAGEVEFQVLGATWFNGWIDGDFFCEGPARFPVAFPEYQTFRAELGAGRHALAFLVNHAGVPTRLMEGVDSFLACNVRAAGRELPLRWKCTRLTGYAPAVRRLNPQFAFIEWCDTRLVPDWPAAGFDDQAWSEPVTVTRTIGALKPYAAANPRALVHELTPAAAGEFTETFGYERDDVTARFFLRDLAPAGLPPQVVQRMQGSSAGWSSFRRMPRGRGEGRQPIDWKYRSNSATPGSWRSAAKGKGGSVARSLGSTPRLPCTSHKASAF